MAKFTFIRQESDFVSTSKSTVEFSAVLLEDILTEFEYFLRGSGFHFDGNVVIDQATWEANNELAEYHLSESEDAN